MARHSHQPDGGFIAKSLTYFVDEVYDYMTFGSVSAFLARRVECPADPAELSRNIKNKNKRLTEKTISPHHASRPQNGRSRSLQVPESRNQGTAPDLDCLLHLLLCLVQHGAAGIEHAAQRRLAFEDDIRLFAICNVALTIPARILVGAALDRFGPRRVFSILMVTMAIPALFFAFGTTKTQLLVSRLVLSSVGASFVVGIHMTALWFKPRSIGFCRGLLCRLEGQLRLGRGSHDAPDHRAHHVRRR